MGSNDNLGLSAASRGALIVPTSIFRQGVLVIAGIRQWLGYAIMPFFHQELAHVGVIFFRLPGATLQAKIEHLNTVLEEHTDELERGAFLVVPPGRIRVAGHPRS